VESVEPEVSALSGQPIWAAVAVLIAFFIVLGYVVHKVVGVAPARLVRVLGALAVVLGVLPAVLYALAEFRS
jgi:hypothetical protein